VHQCEERPREHWEEPGNGQDSESDPDVLAHARIMGQELGTWAGPLFRNDPRNVSAGQRRRREVIRTRNVGCWAFVEPADVYRSQVVAVEPQRHIDSRARPSPRGDERLPESRNPGGVTRLGRTRWSDQASKRTPGRHRPLLARTHHWQDTHERGHPLTESQAKSTGTNLTRQPQTGPPHSHSPLT
jgi:hypothetical protein